MTRPVQVVVTKASGAAVPFSEEKLTRSLLRVGASPETASRIVQELQPKLYPGISTHKIYRWAFSLLKQQSRPAAAKYHLKRAIMELGPSGYPFEKYIAELLRSQGFSTRTGAIVKGACVSHEIDVIAETENSCYFYECKYHHAQGIFCDVKVPLYVQSRFKDVEQALENPPPVRSGGVVTNTRFSSDALRYGNCVGLALLSWDHPAGKGIKDLVDSLSLYPVTCLTTLTKKEKEQLLAAGSVLCSQLHADMRLLKKSGVPESRLRHVMEEVAQLQRSGAIVSPLLKDLR